ncbi:SH3-domain-containing protein [Hygrophoropsis aurantiaca]|uniref:SH3-domain-containing protein n=1 Tax=Hygrophoropsis aurantiaca TaxID=72124 RepID=A0ACB8AGL8_9AGAM|nr:SH3-domain-containing protein [Hygrophoropsis aurantiaca]
MSASAELQAATLLAHISSQLSLNVAFLESQNYLSTADASIMRDIISRLPVSGSVTTSSQVKVSTSTSSTPSSTTVVRSVGAMPVRSVPARPPLASAAPQVVYAKALWAYNEDGSDSADLSFSAGELVEIVSENNADWWLGRARGKEALFPSNHVEKVDPVSVSAVTASSGSGPPTRAYRPFGAALHGTDKPPPGTVGVNSVGLQEASGQAEKKSKYGHLGNTMANSAAGGVGFGAGAAIGGGLVRAIF